MPEDTGLGDSLLSFIPNNFTMPDVDTTSIQDTSIGSSILDGVGGLKGFGNFANILGDIWGNMEQRKYQKSLLKREDARISRDRARQDKFDNGMQKAWA
ncbi:MAG: hypothetical protein PHI79_03410 [Sulfurovaceae bacterium]|nr:hypothetical protein [Sulfurovaceae bacterium]MDD5548629.1 hypothetical protein [Sulfurovaceae bacterium]